MEADLPDFDALWDYGDPATSEGRFRELLPAAHASGNASYEAQLLTQIARTQGLQGHLDAAHRTLDEAEALLAPDDALGRIRYLLERGRALNSSGDPMGARSPFLEAWELASQAGEDYHAVDAAHMLGIVEPPKTQLEWSLRALRLTEGSADPRVRTWLGPLYNNLGWTYHDLGQYEEALRLFQQSLDWRREQGQPRESRIAAWTVGRCLRSLGRIEEALAMQEETLRATEAGGEPDGYVEEEIAECLLALDRRVEAAPHFARAYTLLSSDGWLAEHEGERLNRLRELGGV